jgi:hypothetical protein
MGVLTLARTFTDYGANTWASNPNMVATQNVIDQALADLSAGLYFQNAADQTITIDFGNNAVGPTGTVVSGAESIQAGGSTFTYTQMRNAYLAILATTPNSIQSLAWNSSNLPSVDPINDGPYQPRNILGYVLGLNVITNSYVGVQASAYPDLDIHGMGAGVNYYQAVMHEVTEMLGRRLMEEFWWYDGVGSRQIGNVAHYLSYNGGATASKLYDLASSGDKWDASSGQTAFNAIAVTGAVSRSNTVPLFDLDWQTMTTVGWGLTTSGLAWAGLSNPQGTFSPGLKR